MDATKITAAETATAIIPPPSRDLFEKMAREGCAEMVQRMQERPTSPTAEQLEQDWFRVAQVMYAEIAKRGGTLPAQVNPHPKLTGGIQSVKARRKVE